MADRDAKRIPDATVARLPIYLRSLLELSADTLTVSSEQLADSAGVNAAKVRKDLSYLGSYGTRGVGYDVEYLQNQMRKALGLTHDWPVVIVGMGNLGAALANYGMPNVDKVRAMSDRDSNLGTLKYKVVLNEPTGTPTRPTSPRSSTTPPRRPPAPPTPGR